MDSRPLNFQYKKGTGLEKPEPRQGLREAPGYVECLWDEKFLAEEISKYHTRRIEVLKDRVAKSLGELKDKYNIDLST